jgi:hypothetical protein
MVLRRTAKDQSHTAQPRQILSTDLALLTIRDRSLARAFRWPPAPDVARDSGRGSTITGVESPL